MSNEKRPAPVEGAPVSDAPAAPGPEEAEPDFFSDEEHDGWSPIVKRSSNPPEPPPE